MSRFMSERFADLEVYTPGEQPRDMKYIKLNTNESPYPPSPEVVEALSKNEIELLNLYPDPTCKELTAKIAGLYGLKPENVFISNGSDETLSFAFMAFCDEDRKMAFPSISYGFYPVYGELYGIDCLQIPLKDDFTIDYKDYLNLNRNIVIANPNAPTGLTLSLPQIEEILTTNPDYVVIIDEAYVDFGAESCAGLVEKYPNLLVVMTYSKSRSMAGARLGFALAQKEIIDDLNKIKFSTNPYNINRLTLVAGAAAVDSDAYYKECCKKVVAAREYTQEKLHALGFETLDSKSNFIFARHPEIDGEKFYLMLKSKGILVRHFSREEIKDYLRITVGTKEQMDSLLDAAAQIIREEAK